MYVVISIVSAVLPLLIVVLLWRLLYKVLRSVLEKGGKYPAQIGLPEEQPQETRDLAAEIERKLRQKRQNASEAAAKSGFDVYKEPAPAAAAIQENWRPASAVAPVQEKTRTKVRFTHETLVNGFIIGEILGKPRSINPYDGKF